MHLDAATTCAHYHVYRPFHLFLSLTNGGTSQTVAEDIMRCITRKHAFAQPPHADASWAVLLQDLLRLQSTVFCATQPRICFVSFAQSVLSSGRAALAKQLIEQLCNSEPPRLDSAEAGWLVLEAGASVANLTISRKRFF